jgi:hypothetical protein
VRFGEAQVEVGKGRREQKRSALSKAVAVRLLSVEGRLTSRRTGRFEAIDKGNGAGECGAGRGDGVPGAVRYPGK